MYYTLFAHTTALQTNSGAAVWAYYATLVPNFVTERVVDTMTNRQKVFWITRTAILIAVLLVVQTLSSALGQYVTGSLVNLILILSVMLSGLFSGLAVAVVSPVFAFFLGIGPAMPPIVPFIMLGNAVIVLLWHFIAGKAKGNAIVSYCIATIVGAVAKFATLYFGIVQLAIPFILSLPEKQAAVLSVSFSFPQLITASIGGAVAVILLPLLKKIIKI